MSLADNATERKGTLEAILVARGLADLRLPTAAVATDLATGRATAFIPAELIPALLASSAHPRNVPTSDHWRSHVHRRTREPTSRPGSQLSVGQKSIVVLDTGSREQPPVSASPTKVAGESTAYQCQPASRASLAYASARPRARTSTPENLGAALDFRGTMMAASSAYELARQFLFDATQSRRTKLNPVSTRDLERYAHDPASACSPPRRTVGSGSWLIFGSPSAPFVSGGLANAPLARLACARQRSTVGYTWTHCRHRQQERSTRRCSLICRTRSKEPATALWDSVPTTRPLSSTWRSTLQARRRRPTRTQNHAAQTSRQDFRSGI